MHGNLKSRLEAGTPRARRDEIMQSIEPKIVLTPAKHTTPLHIDRIKAPAIAEMDIIEHLGSGSNGQVWKAKQLRLNRIVAIKVFAGLNQLDALALKRFQKEARLTHQLNHPNIVKTLSMGLTEDGTPFLLQEFVEGENLAEYLRKKQKLSLFEFKTIFLQILEALDYAHRNGIIHRDIKPANIMIDSTVARNPRIKILDFGVAKALTNCATTKGAVTQTGAVIGSARYMSPEQCKGANTNERSDLYSLACTMFEAISGSAPFSGTNAVEIMQQHLMMAPPSVAHFSRRAGIDRNLATLILAGLSKDPTGRPASAKIFYDNLLSASSQISSADLECTPSKTPLEISKNRILKYTGICLAIFLCLLMLSKFSANHGNRESRGKATTTSAHEFRASLAVKERESYLHYLQSTEKLHEKDSLQLLTILHSLANAYCKAGNHAEEISCLDRALRIRRKALNPADLHIADSLRNAADAHAHVAEYAMSELLFKEALELRLKANLENADLLDLYSDYGNICRADGKVVAAIPMLKQELALALKLFHKNDEHVIRAYRDLYLCLLAAPSNESLSGLVEEIKKQYGSTDVVQEAALAKRDEDKDAVNQILRDTRIFTGEHPLD